MAGVSGTRKCDENETGACSLLKKTPRPRKIKARMEGWINAETYDKARRKWSSPGGQSIDIHCNFFFQLRLFGNCLNKMLAEETGEVFRDLITLRLVEHKEFGLYPKTGRKPLNDFDQEGHRIRFVFQSSSGCCVWGGAGVSEGWTGSEPQ